MHDNNSTRRLRRELRAAVKLDPRLQLLLDNYGFPAPRSRPPGFATLLQIIVSQQLSTGAAASIWQKLQKHCNGVITARKILNRDADALRQCGLSRQKAGYMHGLARMSTRRELDIDALGELAAETAIEKLCAVRGFGRWSAEIYLMFALGNRDVFPAGDLALQVAVQRFEKLRERPTAKQTALLAQKWSPHRSGVALLMWKYYGAATLD